MFHRIRIFNNNVNIFFRLDELEIVNQSFKIDPVVSQYVNDEFSVDDRGISSANINIINEIIDENIVGIPVLLVNDHFWYSKPIVMNLTTQQIFFQLSTENNGILVLVYIYLYTYI